MNPGRTRCVPLDFHAPIRTLINIMSTNTMRFAPPLLVFAVLVLLTGCTVYERNYPGRSADQVWSAMVAVAQQPDYSSEKWGKWHVMQNEVWVDEPKARIEVYRELRRVVHNAGSVGPDEQDREYRMTIRLRDSGTPRIRFETRALEIPADGFTESQRFFDDVGELLEGMPSGVAPELPAAPPADATPPTARDMDEAPPTVDVDEME